MKQTTLTQSRAPGRVNGWTHTSTQYMDFLETFNISLDLFTTYFDHFSGC